LPREQTFLHSLGPDIEATNDIPWRHQSALRAAVGPLMFASLPTDGTRLRGIRFIDLNCAGQLIARLLNDSRIKGTYQQALTLDRLPAGSRSFISRFCCQSLMIEVILSKEPHTPPSPTMHVPVGYLRHNAR
jgi:hypothetical protein